MRILGVDPGLTRCGLGVVETLGGRRVKLIDVDVARTDKDLAPEKRLLLISNKLEETMRLLRPDVVVIERVFAQDNVRSVIGTAQAAGVVMLTAAQRSLPVFLYSPSEVKAAVTGHGAAPKMQVQLMVQRILGLREIPRPKDAADALAIAICHAWRGALLSAPSTSYGQHGGAGMLPAVAGPDLTPAQRIWAEQERLQKRHGAVAPRKTKQNDSKPTTL